MTEKEQQLEREIRSLKKEIEILNSIAELKSRFKPMPETEIETEKEFFDIDSEEPFETYSGYGMILTKEEWEGL